MDGTCGHPVLGDRDPETEGMGESTAGGDVDSDGIPQPEQWRPLWVATSLSSQGSCLMITKASLPTCTGTHTAQRMFGCEVQEDGSSSSFWQFGFDGQDHLSLDVETLSWVSAEPVAVRTKRWWETERCYAEYDKAYLEGLCLTSLHRYLELGSQSLTRKEPPMVHITKHMTQDGTTLRCWALGFYPQDISLNWWLDGEELTLETEHVETRPSGDGTYQTWVAVQVPAGKEAWYSCHVRHPGLNHTLTVAWESPSNSGLIAMAISTVLITIMLIAVTVIWSKRCLQAWNKKSYVQTPGQDPESQCPVTAGTPQSSLLTEIPFTT
ncbi:H-2 class I histocompatibility antigen, alpha chain isoform X14 [Oryctolagus cuniculus]|uniref:H-2 class I histocompatibility antigen, alpha chain isoform X14 n=1 Tax=Oryctolagus cuniculus TaxID=9986 RepID=UPI00387A6242